MRDSMLPITGGIIVRAIGAIALGQVLASVLYDRRVVHVHPQEVLRPD